MKTADESKRANLQGKCIPVGGSGYCKTARTETEVVIVLDIFATRLTVVCYIQLDGSKWFKQQNILQNYRIYYIYKRYMCCYCCVTNYSSFTCPCA